jgi:hypothetical protein
MDGQFSSPNGVATDCRGSVYVADTGNYRIQKFGDAAAAQPPCTTAGGGDPGPGPGPGPGPTADLVKPAMTSFALSPARFAAAPQGGSVARVRGTRVSFTLSEAAAVRFTVRRARPGRRVGTRCVRPTRTNVNRRRCTRYVLLSGSFTRQGAAGNNHFRFTGRLRGRRLALGRYRLFGLPTDPAGNKGAVVRKGFQVIRP